MVSFVYDGPDAEKLLWGVTFPRGVAVDVEDEGLIAKCKTIGCFSESQALTRDEEPTSVPEGNGNKRGRPKNTSSYDMSTSDLRIDVEKAIRLPRDKLLDLAKIRGISLSGSYMKKPEIVQKLVDAYGKLD